MARSRVYTVEFDNVSVSVVQDLFSILASSTVPIEIHSVTLGQKTSTSVATLRVRGRRVAGPTQGSGGATPTPRPALPTDQASVVTAHTNDTTQASGTIVTLWADVWNVVNGYLYLPPSDDRPVVGAGQLFLFDLDDAPGSALTVSGTCTFGELA